MPDWFAAIAGETFAPILWVIFVAAAVSLLAIVVLLVLRKASGSRSMMGARGRTPRLGVIEMINVGDRRRLVLVRQDDAEHLLLVGGTTDVVVERNVKRTVLGSDRTGVSADADGGG